MTSMTDDEPNQVEPEPQPEAMPEVEPVGLQEPEIQQAIADDADWMQKGATSSDFETR